MCELEDLQLDSDSLAAPLLPAAVQDLEAVEPGRGLAARALLDGAMLVFPFFAWGTSMPALKLVQPHIPFPFLLGSLRLLPAGLLLIAWAAANGRKHPSTPEAWAWITLFALVDGALFQVRAHFTLTHHSLTHT